MGKWLITVNDQNILENSDLSEKIVPVFNDDSDYIAEGKIAPTSTGYIVITIDYSKVNVPFKYDISCVADATDILKDFTFTSYSIDGGTEIAVDDPTSPITDTVLPEDTTRTRTLKLNFEWLDGEGEDLNDIEDTFFASENDELGIRFDLEFTQLQPTT